MENLKVRVNNESESKEIQELFVVLGAVCCSGLERNKNVNFLFMNSGFVTACKLQENFDKSKCKEITLPELRDLVVLKRNDRNDRTHTDQDNWSWFISSNGTGYVFGAGNANGLHQWDESSLNMVDLKPIEKKEMKAKEYLKKIGNNEYMLMDGVGYSGQDNWIEVPDGADIYIGLTGKINGFYKDNFKQTYLDDDEGWVDTTAGNSYDWLRNTILWKRNPEPKQAEFLVKTDGGYVLQVLDENAGGEDVVRVPDGADTFAGDDNCHYFWQHRSGKKHLLIGCGSSLERYPQWVECEDSADEWLSNFDGDNSLRILWQREISAEEFKSKLPESTFKDFKQPEDLPFLDNGVDIGVENLPEFKPFNNGPVEHDSTAFANIGIEYSIKKEIKTDFPLNNYELNHRVAKAFNAVRGTDLNEDDVNYLRELINLTISHYGERK